MDYAGFDWDAGNRGKCERHGLSIPEIEAFFAGSVRIVPDMAHSESEDRMIAVGRTRGGQPVFVAFTLRWSGGDILIRPISARYMHREESARYEGSETQDGR